MSNLQYKVGDKFKRNQNGLIVEIIEIQRGEHPYVLNGGGITCGDHLDAYYKKVIEFKVNINEQVGGNHYSNLKIQPYQYAFENELNCYQFNIVKYVTRYKNKNGIEDLKKAKHTLEKLIEQESN